MCKSVMTNVSDYFNWNFYNIYENRKYNIEEGSVTIGSNQYQKYTCIADPIEMAPYKLWHPFAKLSKRYEGSGAGMIRALSYIPLYSLTYGLREIACGLESLKDRVFYNRNFMWIETIDLKDDKKNIILERSEHRLVSLSVLQRMVISAICVVNIVRGLFAVFQIGFLFIPIDYVADKIGGDGFLFT